MVGLNTETSRVPTCLKSTPLPEFPPPQFLPPLNSTYSNHNQDLHNIIMCLYKVV